MTRNRPTMCFAVVLIAAFPTWASGATLNVPGDFATIQECIDAAQSGVDECVVSPGTYNETINFIGKAITLRSSDGQAVTIIDATGASGCIMDDCSVVKCISGEAQNTVLDGFTITGGTGSECPANAAQTCGGGMFNFGTSPTVSNCTFNGNSTVLGAGMYNDNNSSPAVSNCTFSENTDNYRGAGMYNDNNSSPTVTNCTFNGNLGFSGGGMFNRNGSSPTVTNCTFAGNTVNLNSLSSSGGAMGNLNGSNPTVLDCVFDGNRAGGAGGAMFNFSSNPVVTNCTFTGNFCAQRGGGMYNTDSNPTVSNCSFVGNQAAIFGGGMENRDNSNPEVINCIFSENSAGGGGVGGPPWGGGGMENRQNSSPRLTNCVFTGNFTYGSGGGVYNGSGSSPTITNCTFSGNSSWEDAGGMYNDDGSPAVINSILWGNTDDSDGGSGGPFMDESAQVFTDTGAPVVTFTCIQGLVSGGSFDDGTNIGDAPQFVTGPAPEFNGFHLEQIASGGVVESPCVDGGSGLASETYATGTTRTDEVDDGETVDMGYHYNATFPVETIPTVSQWGLVAMALLMLTAGTLVYTRRRAFHA